MNRPVKLQSFDPAVPHHWHRMIGGGNILYPDPCPIEHPEAYEEVPEPAIDFRSGEPELPGVFSCEGKWLRRKP